MKSSTGQSAEIVIVGAGTVGRLLALSLHGRVAGPVRVIDGAAGPRPNDDIRAYSISAGLRRMLAVLGIWQRLEAYAQPVRAISITDGRLEDMIRPALLDFGDGDQAGDEPLVHFVLAGDLDRIVAEVCDEAGIAVEWGQPVQALQLGEAGAMLATPDVTLSARLVIGADGGRSTVRRLAGITRTGGSYRQTAIVAIIAHEMAHEERAIQHFLPGGPFAILPLPGKRSGLVWTEHPRDAEALLRLPKRELEFEIARRAGPELGEIEIEAGPIAHPLRLSVARRFIAPRLALAGDAAHQFHPLTGQGLNMGLRDGAALAEVVVDAARRGEDIGSLFVLERYERWRRFDSAQHAAVTDLLQRLFASRFPGMRALRDFGLGLVDRAGPVKRQLIAEAAGETGEPPRLFRGLPL